MLPQYPRHVMSSEFDFNRRVTYNGRAVRDPAITIQADGSVSINIAASRVVFGENPPDRASVRIGFNRSGLMTVVPAVPDDPLAFHSRAGRDGGGFTFSAGAYLRENGAVFVGARRFPAYGLADGPGLFIDTRGVSDPVGRNHEVRS